ncbi:MAG TPA: glycoside hydrolase family 88 protein, partial [Ignavibacteriales bacterium]|nr:glycoside hydrolase family 88 protein [Ignavibacteriales bacterium]
LRSQLKTHPRTSEGGFWHKKIYPNQMWLDGLYMAEPFYTQYAQTFNEPEALNVVAKQFELIDKHLKDRETGLYFHGWDESGQMKWADPVKGTSPNFWGRALGWYMMALVDVLDYMSEDHPAHAKLVKSFQDLSASLLNYRDGEKKLWHQIIDKGGKEGNYLEASASMMFIYAYAKGYNEGYLDRKYYGAAMESFNAALKYLVTMDESGAIYLNHTVSVGGLGGNPYRDGSYEYYLSEPQRVNDFKGYGPFLLAAIELEKDTNAVGKGKDVALDCYFNNERKDGKRYHYTWEDEAFSGFSDIGKMFRKLGAETVPIISAPTKESLSNMDIYIIVDPDTKKETAAPNFIDESSISVIIDWVNNGGTLVLLANDTDNCELDHLNNLSQKFGITFTQTSENRVTGSNFEMGKFDQFPAHPIFEGVNKIYLKEISILNITAPVEAILEHDGKIIMAGAHYGKGYVFAVGDPWLYNEYLDNRKLPAGFENYKAAENLFKWLLSGRTPTANK